MTCLTFPPHLCISMRSYASTSGYKPTSYIEVHTILLYLEFCRFILTTSHTLSLFGTGLILNLCSKLSELCFVERLQFILLAS